jgi:hypothetical protein
MYVCIQDTEPDIPIDNEIFSNTNTAGEKYTREDTRLCDVHLDNLIN